MGAAQQDLDTLDQEAAREWFTDVVICARLKVAVNDAEALRGHAGAV